MIAPKSLLVFSGLSVSFGILGILLSKHFGNLIQNKG